jgi:hypothetical protein
MATIPVLGQFLHALLGRFRPPNYGISADGLLCPSKDKPLIPWAQISSFHVEADKRLPHGRVVSLHLNSGTVRAISLPGGDADDAIISEMSNKVSQGAPPEASKPLSARDWAIGIFLAILLSSFGFFSKWPLRQPLPISAPVFILSFLAGPGTWIAIALRGRRAGSQLGSLAIALNMLTTMGLMLFAIARVVVSLKW